MDAATAAHAAAGAGFLQKFGLVIPAILILVGTSMGSLYFFWSNWKKVVADLESLTADLEKILGPLKGTIDLETLDPIFQRMARSPLFHQHWVEFESTLIKDEQDGKVRVYSTRPFSDFIPFEDIMDKRLHAKYFSRMPGLVTSMGLAFTFTFIVIGLAHLKPTDSGKIEGISELIEGLSAKFISSITALAMAITLTVSENNLHQRLEKGYHKLMDLLDRKFEKKTAQDHLRNLENYMREQAESMKSLGTGLADALKEGILEGMVPATEKMVKALENLKGPDNAGMAEALQALTQSLGGLAGGGMADIGKTMDKLSEVMNESAGQMGRTAAQLEKLVSASAPAQEKEREAGAGIPQGEEVVPLLAKVEDNTKSQADNMDLLAQYLEPAKRPVKKRLDEHLRELRQAASPSKK